MDSAARQVAAGGTQVAIISSQGDDIDRLKTLLFRPEAQRLTQVEVRVAGLDAHVGTIERLEAATAQVLVEALRRAEVAEHDQLSRAIAPVVVAVIRNEIINSKDMMVEALYPITGRLVSAGIAVAVGEMLANINARLDALLSINQLKLRYLAWRTGRPISELVLAQTRHGTLVRLLYLERGSGQLLAQWQADHGFDERADLVSGMIAALTSFARNALGEDGGELRTLDLGGRKIYLRSSANRIIAAEYSGDLQIDQQSRLDRGFFDLLDASNHGQTSPEADLDRLAGALVDAPATAGAAKKRISPLSIVAVLLCLVLAWFGLQGWQAWQKRVQIEAALSGFVDAHPDLDGWPVGVEVDAGKKQVLLRGLMPDAALRQGVLAAVSQAAAPYGVVTALGLVASRQSLEAGQAQGAAALKDQIGALQRQIGTATSRLNGAISATKDQNGQRLADVEGGLSGGLAAANAQVEALALEVRQGQARARAVAQDLAATTASTNQKLNALAGRLDSPRAMLTEALQGFAVFFEMDTAILDEAAVRARLAAIVPLAKAAGGVRVIGFADPTGTPARNRVISRARSDRVARMLIELGLPEAQIVQVSRASEAPIADAGDANSHSNRRVILEPLLEGEVHK